MRGSQEEVYAESGEIPRKYAFFGLHVGVLCPLSKSTSEAAIFFKKTTWSYLCTQKQGLLKTLIMFGCQKTVCSLLNSRTAVSQLYPKPKVPAR